MIPAFDPVTGYLPPGIYPATMAEIKERFGATVKRTRLMAGLTTVVSQLWDAGVQEIFIDGSFCTETPVPNDVDGYWVYVRGLDTTKIDPVLLQTAVVITDPATGLPVRPMRLRYGVEFFVHPLSKATPFGMTYPEFFSRSRDGVERGYVRILKDEGQR